MTNHKLELQDELLDKLMAELTYETFETDLYDLIKTRPDKVVAEVFSKHLFDADKIAKENIDKERGDKPKQAETLLEEIFLENCFELLTLSRSSKNINNLNKLLEDEIKGN